MSLAVMTWTDHPDIYEQASQEPGQARQPVDVLASLLMSAYGIDTIYLARREYPEENE